MTTDNLLNKLQIISEYVDSLVEEEKASFDNIARTIKETQGEIKDAIYVDGRVEEEKASFDNIARTIKETQGEIKDAMFAIEHATGVLNDLYFLMKEDYKKYLDGDKQDLKKLFEDLKKDLFPDYHREAKQGEQKMIKPTKPLWVSDFDKHGYYADFEFESVTQRFRWIEAGELWMGALEGEEIAFGDEVRHRVRISEGFWLADTVCTQSLWKAVMGNNPSHFKGDNLPVENVSWLEVKEFITKLNSLAKGLEARLPTEAEWEYCCRAGTETPFAYGEKADSKLMNFNQNLGKTVSAKSLYQNDWGLFQMHGNVWEWCEDWYGEYEIGNELVIDPRGLNTSSGRVLRGGSWISVAWVCRSAYRDRDSPASRSRYFGFRLVSKKEK